MAQGALVERRDRRGPRPGADRRRRTAAAATSWTVSRGRSPRPRRWPRWTAAGPRSSSGSRSSAEILIERLSGRRVCPACRPSINVSRPAARGRPGVCDACGGGLVQRADDAAEVVRERIRGLPRADRARCKAYYRRKSEFPAGRRPGTDRRDLRPRSPGSWTPSRKAAGSGRSRMIVYKTDARDPAPCARAAASWP